MVIADTGFWLALANSQDSYHSRAILALSELKVKLITTGPVITETCHLLAVRLNPEAQILFLKNYEQGAFDIFDLTQKHTKRIIELMDKYSDLPMDLADASLVILAEHLGHGKILSTDQRDFKTYRFKNHKPFQNLLG